MRNTKKILSGIVALVLFSSHALAQAAGPFNPVGPGPLPGVQGPASSTSGHLATFNGTSGKLIQDGGAVPAGTVTSVVCDGVTITTTGTCPTSGKPYFRVNLITAAVTVTGSQTVITFNQTIDDSASYWDGVNYRYTPLVAGRYEFSECAAFKGTSVAGTSINVLYIYKNGTRVTDTQAFPPSITAADNGSICTPGVELTMNGATDYVDARALSTATNGSVDFGTSADQVTWLGGHWLGPQ